MSRKKLDVTKEQLLKLYSAYSGSQIAELYGCTPSAVYSLLRRYDIPRRTNKEAHPGFVQIPKDVLYDLYAKHTQLEIAQKFGRSQEWVRKQIHDAEIKTRPKGPKRTFVISKKRLNALYQKHSAREIAYMFGVGETVIWKNIKEHGIVLKDTPGGHRCKTGLRRSPEHLENMARSRYGTRTGSENHKWKGGITPENARKRASALARYWKARALRKADNKCENCGIDKGFICKCCGQKVQLHVHHIKPFEDNEDLRFEDSNARVLCAACHHAEHFKKTE
jgi:transposase